MIAKPFRLNPEYREYVWGGARLRPEIVPTAEAWVVYEKDVIASGPYAGRTLSDLAAEFGVDLLGRRAITQTGNRFPVLVKILDCAQWLSLQVHPNDQQSVALEGPGMFGKTEAWSVLEAEPGAKLIAGMKPGITAESLDDSIRNGSILDHVQMTEIKAGETVFMSPGTIHALGPGMLIYEIQQTSDITYRVYDWGRPQTETRKLHIDKALAVSRPDAAATPQPAPVLADGETRVLTQCQYFNLELIVAKEKSVSLNTQGESFHALTVIEGEAKITVGDESQALKRFETVLIPAACGAYHIQPVESCRVLKAAV
jgi:mannose-6-phosphate isomerase